mmetsp:Transcript_78246/g.162483  ORF Transcript_78246/g.162483 Transcript_78246/m.162483 type:complete len:286 (+) Transcript_78246:52-909(+)
MTDYRKFEALAREVEDDGEDDDRDKAGSDHEGGSSGSDTERHAAHIAKKAEIDQWLKIKLRKLFPPIDPRAPPELDSSDQVPRKVTDEERGVLAMFLAAADTGKNDSKSPHHRLILELAKANKWLEDDPGVVELLCQLLKLDRDGNNSKPGILDPSGMEEILLNGLNTLAAPSRAGCSKGYGKIYEFFALVSNPESQRALDMRAKYSKKEFAAEAIFDSMMPSKDDHEIGSLLTFSDWCAVGLIVVVFALLIYLAAHGTTLSSSPTLSAFFSSSSSPSGKGPEEL